MDILLQDLRHALRSLRRDVGFTVITILTLAVGIGINTAVFSVVNAVLMQPLPYQEPGRLVMLWTDIAGQGVHEARSSYGNIRDWRAQNRVFEGLATFDPSSFTLTDGDWPEQVSTAKISANFFSVLGVPPVIGRTFSPEEEKQQAPVVVISHSFWKQRFSGSPQAIGRTIELNGTPLQIIGIMPEYFGFPSKDIKLWEPQTLFSDWDAVVTQRGTSSWRVIGRLQPGVTVQQARTDMDVIAGRLEQLYPAANTGLGINVVPLYEQVTGSSFRLALWTLFGAVGLVLLIACANVAHLILARGIARTQEFAIRVALGADRPRLIRQAMTEHILVSLIAGGVGLLFAMGGLRLLFAMAPGNMPRLDEVSIDTPVLVFVSVVSLISGILFGLAPVLGFSRDNPYNALKEGRSPSQKTHRHHVRRALIVFQFALAIVLVFGANLLIRSFLSARSVDPGFQTDNVLMANLSVEASAERVNFYRQVVQNVQTIPGIRSVGIVEDLFISGAPNRDVTVDAGGTSIARGFAQIRADAIDGDYFQTIGVSLLQGRRFTDRDREDTAPVAIINETMARRFWPGESPVGKRFHFGDSRSDNPWVEVVGLVGDMHRRGLENEPIAQVFQPYEQNTSRNMNLLVRTDAPVSGLTAAIRTKIAEIDNTVPLYGITTVPQVLDRFLLQRRFQTLLLSLFSGIALILAAIGIYGLMQYTVTQRTREIGVRMALGAFPRDLVMMVLRQGLTLALPGLAAGIVCALWLSDTLSALLFGVAPTDPTNIAVTSGILLLTTIIACYIPARRAARVDPMTALRYE